MSKKCASTPCIFETPTTHQGGRFWHQMSTLAPLSDLSYNAIGPIFPHFYTQWLSEKRLPSFSFVPNSDQIWHAVQNGEKSNLPGHCTVAGMQLNFDWTDLHEFFTRYSIVDSPSAVWVTPYPHPQIFFG